MLFRSGIHGCGIRVGNNGTGWAGGQRGQHIGTRVVQHRCGLQHAAPLAHYLAIVEATTALRWTHSSSARPGLLERLEERLRRSLAESPKRAIDVFGALFARPIDGKGELLGMATGESLAHINYLLHRREAVVNIDTQGIAWYQASPR